jgi:hypothetical protein
MRQETIVGAGTAATRSRIKLVVGLVVAACALLLAIANAHLLYVATRSEPGCVPHTRLGQGVSAAGSYSAAQSACSPRPEGGQN